ncbi:reverse transcriptase domain-containing protein [Tanacetum coccineum]
MLNDHLYLESSRVSLGPLHYDAVAESLTPSLDRSRRRHFMLATPSLHSVNNTSSWIWCRIMSTSTHPIIILSDFDIEDVFSSTTILDYTSASPNYSPSSSGNTYFDPLEDLSKDLFASLTISPFHDDPYMKVMQAYNATSNESQHHEEQIDAIPNHLDELPLDRIEHMEDKIEGLGLDDEIVLARSQGFYSINDSSRGGKISRLCFLEPLYPDMIYAQDIEHMISTTSSRDTEPPVGLPISLSLSSSVGSSSPVRSTTPPPDYSFDESIFAELDNSLWIIPRPLGSEPVLEEPNEMVPKRTLTSTTPAMTQAAIKKLVADSVVAALKAQAATMANTDNTNRNTQQRETHVATKIKFATGTLTEEALSWWNSFAQPIGIEEAYKIAWSKFKKLLIKKYCPRTEVKKMEDEFYNLTVKGNDLKTYLRRFQELAVLCPTMVPNSEKLMEVFIGGLPRSIEGNVTASKP